MSEPPLPDETPPAGPAIGQDEWVARHGERRAGRGGVLGKIEERLQAAPWYAWLILFVAAFSLLPVVSGSGYIRRVAFDTTLYMLLALGLNVVVGWGGLLDLGFVAFYGIGAYAYALLDSHQLGVHLPTLLSIPLVVAIGGLVGFLVGLPSRRLTGDYLAIVTLFFLQIYLTVATNGRLDLRTQHHGRGERDPARRPARAVRPLPRRAAPGHLRRRLPLRVRRRLRGRLHRAPLHQPLAHRTRLAVAAGRTRSRPRRWGCR